MALSNQDIKTLEEIVSTDGKCMDSMRCMKCPFRAMCLPEFLNPVPPTTQQRKIMAIDVLSHHALVDENLIIEEYRWDKK
jgi:hypothetical protein